MKVALFASAFYPSLGGVEELVRQLSHAYRKKNISTIVLTNRWPRSLPAYEEYEGIPVHRLAFRVPEGSVKAHINYKLTHKAIVREMLNILNSAKVDMLHVQCVSSNGYYAMLAKQILGLPLVVTTQGERTMDANKIYNTSKFLNQALRSLLSEADYITACSQNTMDDMEAYYNKPFGSRACVVYNGINLDDFCREHPYKHPKPYILGIGRLVTQKGFDLLIQAYAQANMNSHDLILAGDGAERQALEKLAEKLGLQDKVKFIGRADRPTAISLFRGCDFFVLPSREEPQGIVNLEAMAAGKAVIATNVGGVSEIVLDRRTGLLVESNNIAALSLALLRLSDDAALKHKLGTAGKERAQQFAWSSIADQYITIYNSINSN